MTRRSWICERVTDRGYSWIYLFDRRLTVFSARGAGYGNNEIEVYVNTGRLKMNWRVWGKSR